MNQAFLKHVTMAISAVFALSLPAQSNADIDRIVPHEIKGFTSDWCAKNILSGRSPVVEICFGNSEFKFQTARAVVLIFADGHEELYLDEDYGGVDLARLKIRMVGPVKFEDLIVSTDVEFADVQFSIDGDGEVNAVHIQSRRLGYAIAFRKN